MAGEFNFLVDDISRELAELLVQEKGEIINSWACMVMDIPDSPYQQFTYEETLTWAAENLETIIRVLESGSDLNTNMYVNRLIPARLQLEIPIFSITEAFLCVKDAIQPQLGKAYSTDADKTLAVSQRIDLCIRNLVKQFEMSYSETLHRKLIEESEKRVAEIESLHRTMTALLQKLNLDEMLEIVCAEAQRLTGASGSALLFLQDEGWLQVTISTGDPIPVLDRLPVADSIAGTSLQKGEPYLINEPVNKVQAYHRNPDLESLLVIPLQVEGKSIGVIDVVNKSGGFSDDDIRIMSLFADQAAIALQNAQFHKKTEQLAVVEERQRLARELHDSVSQSLYSTILYTDAARLAMSNGDSKQVLENLKELHNIVHEAMLDMRLLIFELHPPILEKEGLVAALRTRLEAVEARSGIHTKFETNREERLPIQMEADLYRIAQEALNNAVKHSQAQNISVHLNFSAANFRMKIWDNGIGFVPKSKENSGGLGLRGIEDRVVRMNGTFEIESKPGEGTLLSVEVCI